MFEEVGFLVYVEVTWCERCTSHNEGVTPHNFTYIRSRLFAASWVLKGIPVDSLFVVNSLNPLSDDKILDRSNLKQSAEDIFKFDEISRKFSKRVENTVGKGEIARYEQFLLFPQCFQKACFLGASKGVIVWEWV